MCCAVWTLPQDTFNDIKLQFHITNAILYQRLESKKKYFEPFSLDADLAGKFNNTLKTHCWETKSRKYYIYVT